MITSLLPRIPDMNMHKVLELCQQLAPGENLLYVPIIEVNDAKPVDCFLNVANQIKSDGGEIVYGWAIWHLPGFFVEAEFHSVWRSPEGHLFDVTPRSYELQEILFLPDPARIYKGKQVNSYRIPVHDDPQISELMETHNQIFEVMNKGDRVNMHGEITIPSAEIVPLKLKQMQLEESITHKYIDKLQKCGRNESCPCGSERKFKSCCYQNRFV
jgi:hypothetical protein